MLFAIVAIVLAGCQTDGNGGKNTSLSTSVSPMSELAVAQTWEQGWVYIPQDVAGSFVNGTIGDRETHHKIRGIPADAEIPAIVYLHGCTGLRSASFAGGNDRPPDKVSSYDLQVLGGMGFAVFAPDSFARPGRETNCPEGKVVASEPVPEVGRLRQEEAAYAAEQLRKLPWIDHDRIYLVGFSEGGTAAALYTERDFAGIVIIGWTCVSEVNGQRYRKYDGIRVPSDIPILAIVGARDRVFQNPWNRGNCGERMAGRENARSVVLDTDQHHVTNFSSARRALEQFFRPDEAVVAGK